MQGPEHQSAVSSLVEDAKHASSGPCFDDASADAALLDMSAHAAWSYLSMLSEAAETQANSETILLHAGWPMAKHSLPAQPEHEAATVVPAASARGNEPLKGSDGLRSMSPSAADVSDTGSFASAESQDLDGALLEDEALGRTTLPSTQDLFASLIIQAFEDAFCSHAPVSLHPGHCNG